MRWKLAALAVAIIAGVAAVSLFALSRGDDLSAFRPFAVKEERRSYGQNTYYREGIPPDSPPCVVDTIELENVSVDQIESILRSNFAPDRGWNRTAEPGTDIVLYLGNKPWSNASKTIAITFRRPTDVRPISRSAVIVSYRFRNPLESWSGRR